MTSNECFPKKECLSQETKPCKAQKIFPAVNLLVNKGLFVNIQRLLLENSGVSRVMMPQNLFHRGSPQSVLVLLLPKVVFLPVAGDEKSRGLQVLNILVPTVNYHFNEVDCSILMEMMMLMMLMVTCSHWKPRCG